jgi:lysophospholipid acyltransferase (LPLAT)-like uncharacterized protein
MLFRTRQYLFVFTVEQALRLSRMLWRVQLVDPPPPDSGPQVYAHWHGDELPLVPLFGGSGFAVMSSRSRDGEAMAKLLARFGYFVVRGSSSRGGAGGLKGLVDAVRQGGRSAAIAVDGPRGPVYKAKPGICLLAQSTGLPIVPAAVFASRRWEIPGAWNRGFFPKPFSKCVVVYGAPLHVPSNSNESGRLALTVELETRLTALKKKAEAIALAPAFPRPSENKT